MTVGDICKHIDEQIPVALQESYDNSGLQTGSYDSTLTSVLLTIDVTEKVIEEAVSKQCNLIISHHPMIFSPLKRVTDSSPVQRMVVAAIQNGIAIYSAHTNLDSVYGGVSFKMASKLGLTNREVLSPVSDKLVKLVTFVPPDHLERVKQAIFEAGAGHIGDYDSCGFQIPGEGSFRGNEKSNPFAGTRGQLHYENEIRFETILPSFLTGRVVKALIATHPYEEPAFDLYPLLNKWNRAGMGCIGMVESPISADVLLARVKSLFSAEVLRYSGNSAKQLQRIAVCGGSGITLLPDAIAAGADAFITGDIKYHQFFEAQQNILLVDAGHFETEKFSMEIIYDLIIKKFPNFALRFSESITNPINYF
jgi:dinuclear metal center YbgI/SA1388 family protein